MERRKRIARGLFAAYCILMLILLFCRQRVHSDLSYPAQLPLHFNLKPFMSIKIFLNILRNNSHSSLQPFAVSNLVGNVVMFIPLGFFLPLCFPKLRKFHWALLASFGIITAVETAQLFTLLGNFDIDDFLLNLPGACFGYWLYWLFIGRKQAKSGF